MFSSFAGNRLFLTAGRKFVGSSRAQQHDRILGGTTPSVFGLNVNSSLPTASYLMAQYRWLSDVSAPSSPSAAAAAADKLDKNQGRFKDMFPPRTLLKREVIIEPPVRSRPFRQFRGSRPVHQRCAPRRVSVITTTTLPKERYGSFPVRAVQAAQTIDLAAVMSKVFATKGARKMMERQSVVVQLPPQDPSSNGSSDQAPRFVAVFRFGSVVFFNVSPRESSTLLAQLKKHAKEPVLSGFERKESFCVHIHPQADENDKVVTGEYCVVQELNMKSVDVISNVLAQSVALDSYNDTVDELLANFARINGTVIKQGNLTTVDRDNLFRTVAQNNSIFIDMVSKLGIKDRSDTAWNLTQYEDIHEGMKEEFAINLRFHDIEFKLDLIQQNAKFFLEVLQSQKSNTLEWIIIVLITFECGLMCMEMSGVGTGFFGAMAKLNPF
jgi:uncharacterized Rmd1/YagE family protein